MYRCNVGEIVFMTEIGIDKLIDSNISSRRAVVVKADRFTIF